MSAVVAFWRLRLVETEEERTIHSTNSGYRALSCFDKQTKNYSSACAAEEPTFVPKILRTRDTCARLSASSFSREYVGQRENVVRFMRVVCLKLPSFGEMKKTILNWRQSTKKYFGFGRERTRRVSIIPQQQTQQT